MPLIPVYLRHRVAVIAPPTPEPQLPTYYGGTSTTSFPTRLTPTPAGTLLGIGRATLRATPVEHPDDVLVLLLVAALDD